MTILKNKNQIKEKEIEKVTIELAEDINPGLKDIEQGHVIDLEEAQELLL